MKLALLLSGLSYCNYYNNDIQKKYFINYLLSVDNYIEYIYNYFIKLGYEIDVYISTNEMSYEKKQELLNIYKPVSFSFTDMNTSRNERLINCLKLCLDSKINYDLCFITRFDLLFKKKFNIDFNKINMVSIVLNEFIDDNLYIFPYKYLIQFYDMFLKNKDISSHYIKKDIENIGPIHYLLNEENKQVIYLNFYKIVRNTTIPFNYLT